MKKKAIILVGYIVATIAVFITVDLVPEFVVKRPDTTSHIQENVLQESLPTTYWWSESTPVGQNCE